MGILPHNAHTCWNRLFGGWPPGSGENCWLFTAGPANLQKSLRGPFPRPLEGAHMAIRPRLLSLVLTAVSLLALLPAARGVEEDDIKQAVQAGVRYLQSIQGQDGSWTYNEGGFTEGYAIGVTALN